MDVEGDISKGDDNNPTNEWLAKTLGVTVRQISRYRADQMLPSVQATPEEIIAHLFNILKNAGRTVTAKEAKILAETRRLQIQNDRAEGKLIDKA